MADIRVGLHPELLTKIDGVLTAMLLKGSPMKIVQGLRTTEQQHQLWLQGRDPNHPGPIVTHADGVKVRSNHQADPIDGLGRAVDCAFLGGEPFSEKHPWSVYGATCEAAGLVWGGGHTHGWHGQDRPHAQLPNCN